MLPAEVRASILAAHKELGFDLDELEWQIAWVLDEKLDHVPEGLKRAFDTFFGHLVTHMQTEDEVLVPELAEADTAGEVATRQVEQHHTADLDLLARVFHLLSDPDTPPAGWVEAFRDLIGQVRAEIDQENRELLTNPVVQDPIVPVDAVAG